MSERYHILTSELQAIAAAGLARRLRPVDGPQGATLVVDGKPAINFSSNNYLGLANHPLLVDAAMKACHEYGFGSGASRHIVGNLVPHRALEEVLRTWKGTEAALLFNSGYQANVGILQALAGREDAIFSDALNHASLIDGARLSRARVSVYAHADMNDLEEKLTQASSARRRVIVTDTVFSMDGDVAPMADLAILAKKYDAFVVADEAHAVGVHGKNGSGLCQPDQADVQMGTLGKALGGFGAYVAGSQKIIDLIINRARSLIFTTALPVPVVAAAEAAIVWLQSDDGKARMTQLHERCEQLFVGLRKFNLAPAQPTHIVPLRVKDANPQATMQLSTLLLERGIYAQGIRPPTVPEGTSRLRFTVMATHTAAQIDRALAVLGDLRDQFV